MDDKIKEGGRNAHSKKVKVCLKRCELVIDISETTNQFIPKSKSQRLFTNRFVDIINVRKNEMCPLTIAGQLLYSKMIIHYVQG